MSLNRKRYVIQWVTPFGRKVVHYAGQGESREYVHRRARELSQGWRDCYVRVVDTEPVPPEVTVYQYGKEVTRDETQ